MRIIRRESVLFNFCGQKILKLHEMNVGVKILMEKSSILFLIFGGRSTDVECCVGNFIELPLIRHSTLCFWYWRLWYQLSTNECNMMLCLIGLVESYVKHDWNSPLYLFQCVYVGRTVRFHLTGLWSYWDWIEISLVWYNGQENFFVLLCSLTFCENLLL